MDKYLHKTIGGAIFERKEITEVSNDKTKEGKKVNNNAGDLPNIRRVYRRKTTKQYKPQ